MKKSLLAIALGIPLIFGSGIPVMAEEAQVESATKAAIEMQAETSTEIQTEMPTESNEEMIVEEERKESSYGTLIDSGYLSSGYVKFDLYDTDNDNVGDLLDFINAPADANRFYPVIEPTSNYIKYSYDIKQIVIESGIERLGSECFCRFEKLESVVLSDTVTAIEYSAFEGCVNLKSITLNNGLQRISFSVFKDCTALESISFPRTVSSIYVNAFEGCANLKAIHVSDENRYFSSKDGVLYSKDGKKLLLYPMNHGTEYTIPDGVTSIGPYAFPDNLSLKVLTIPKSVTSIETTSFPDVDKRSITDIYYNGPKTGSIRYITYSPLDRVNLHYYVPIYRLYSPVNAEHLYTTDTNEVRTLVKLHKWNYEGVSWMAPSDGTPVYRLYNPGLQNHLYTTDTNEVNELTAKHGWVKDNNGEPLFYSGGSTEIFRLYNYELRGLHLWTNDSNEYKVLPGYGWKQEGTVMNGVAGGDPAYPMP